MSEILYRIKKLKWTPGMYGRLLYTDSLFGLIDIFNDIGSPTLQVRCEEGGFIEPCESEKAGKARAEKWYRERLSESLEPVDPQPNHVERSEG